MRYNNDNQNNESEDEIEPVKGTFQMVFDLANKLL